MQFRVFLIGLGGIAVKYDLKESSTFGKTHARAIDNHANFDLVGGYDPSKKNRVEFSRHYKKKAYDNLERGLRETNPEVVVVASPTEKHLQSVEQILNCGDPSLILCEKPISFNVEDARRILELCQVRKIPLFVNYFRNSEPSTFEIADRIYRKKMVKPFKGICIYNKGALHTATHFLNLFQIWFGEGIEYIFNSERYNSHNPQDPNIEFEVKYEDGSIKFRVDDSTDSLRFYSFIEFSNGVLKYENEGEEISWIELERFRKNQNHSLVEAEMIESVISKSQFNAWNEISNYLNLKKFKLCTGQDALQYIIQVASLKRN